ncbi:MAG: putative metal-binding motif-containing protein [Deltaproteobacteria bacterium]|nr:putative metal-binding motif-containing protein [Deltaproteobacteria bacterium]
MSRPARLSALLCLFALACKDDGPTVEDTALVPPDEEVDADGDGFNELEDCDDGDAAVNPEATETCDGLDNDCDGEADEADAADATSWSEDKDGDGFGDSATITLSCEPPAEGWVSSDGDCDDSDVAYYPGAPETDCGDPADYNCDGSSGFTDADLDGFAACEECDDGDGAVNPDATEICDSIDNDCDTAIDEDDAADAGTWYQDADGDSYGDADFTAQACETPAGYVGDSTDCDDGDTTVNPAATERCDSIDNDCDSQVDEPDAADAETFYADTDADGFGDADYPTAACDVPTGYSALSTDCDDAVTAVNPDADELCDDVDNDCDGDIDEDDAVDATEWYNDDDGDGFGDPDAGGRSCDVPTGVSLDDSDCDDTNDWSNPDAAERPDGEDNDCDGDIDDDLHLGTGADGDLTVSGTVLLSDEGSNGRAEPDGIAWPVVAFGPSTVTVNTTVTGLAAGDELLIINLHGSDAAYTNVGAYEFATVVSVSGDTITLAQAISETFGVADNSDLSGQTIVAQRVPNYDDVTVSAGSTLSVAAWDGQTGGVLAFRAQGALTVESGGSVTASALGYLGGATGTSYNCDSYQGESFAGEGEGDGNGACAAYNESYGHWINNYGGGGAHITGGGGEYGGGATAGASWDGGSATAPYKGATYGDTSLTTLFFGSGGGGVWQGINNCTGAGYGPGGDGAGIVYVTAGTLTATGGAAFTASGGSSNHCAQGSWTYGAGGGAGGTLWLAADTLSLASGAVDAQGGLGNSSNIRVGGNGGSGRVRLDCATCNGYTNGSAGAATALSDAATPDPAVSMVP